MTVVCGRALLPAGIATVAIELRGPTIVDVRAPRSSDPPAVEGLVVPGLVNAHLHLEMSWLAGRIASTGLGFPEWAARLPRRPDAEARTAAARFEAAHLVDLGTAAVLDVGNGGDTAGWLDEAGVAGIAVTELLGFSRSTLPDRLHRASGIGGRTGRIAVRPAAHAIYSTPPELIRAALAPHGGVPGTIHIAEDPAEQELLAGAGPWPGILDGLGIDWRWWSPPGGSPVEYLASLGVLRPDVVLVHGVHLSPSDVAAIAGAGAPLVLCPRSNLHIGGRLPDVPALIAAGVRLALGTDSLASSPSLDVLEEIPALARAFPSIDPARWLRIATAGGADALGLGDLGEIAVGRSPGLLLLQDVAHPAEIAERTPARRWLVDPRAPLEVA